MLSFDIRATTSKATHVEGAVSPDDPIWEEDDPQPAEPLRVEGRLSPAGAGRFYLTGRMRAPVEMACRRCLTEVRANVEEEIQALFAPIGDEDTSDPDVFVYDPNVRDLDLRPALRELWLLAVPRFVLCQEACKGLCPRCGRDLNTGDCDCRAQIDSRWEALRAPVKSQG